MSLPESASALQALEACASFALMKPTKLYHRPVLKAHVDIFYLGDLLIQIVTPQLFHTFIHHKYTDDSFDYRLDVECIDIDRLSVYLRISFPKIFKTLLLRQL